MASYKDYQIDVESLQDIARSAQNPIASRDLQLAAELGKTLLERNKELENLLRAHQKQCSDQKLEIEYLTKQNIALKEVNDSRMQIYESLDVSIRDLEIEKHSLVVQTSNDKKLIKSLKQNIESLELRCDELSKQIEEITYSLEQEKRKNERLRGSTATTNADSTTPPKPLDASKLRHTSASEPESEEACTPTNPIKSFTNCSVAQNVTSPHLPFMNYSQDFSSIQPIYSLDSNESGFKTGSSSNSADHDEMLRLMSELEDTKQQYVNEHRLVAELEQQLSVLATENQNLQTRIVQSNTLDEMKSVHEELSFLEEVRQGQMCTRCLKSFDSRMVPTENTSYIGTEGDDDDDRSLMDLLNSSSTLPGAPVYRSAVTIKDDETSSQHDCDPKESFNPYKDLVEKYEKLLELKRSGCPKKDAPQSLQDELLNSGEFSSFNTKYTSDDEKEKKSTVGARHKTPTDFSETETTSSGFSDETSTKATQTEDNPGSFLFSIADGEDCKFTIYDDAAPIENRFRDRPKYRDLFKEIFTVLKKAAENKDEGEKLPLLDDKLPESSSVPPVTPANEHPPCDFDSQSVLSESVMSENSVAISECITKTERKKAKSHKKQAVKEEAENKPPSAVQMVAGKLVTPYNRVALDLMALNAKKRARRSRHRSKDKYSHGGRDSSVTSVASNTSSIAEVPIEEEGAAEAGDQSTLTRNRKGRKHRELFQTISTMSNADWNGDSITVYNRNSRNPPNFYCRPSSSAENTSEIEFKHSAAHTELRKLKKLDLSYAEVLRQADRRRRQHK